MPIFVIKQSYKAFTLVFTKCFYIAFHTHNSLKNIVYQKLNCFILQRIILKAR